MVSSWHVCGTRGLGIVSSAADVLCMSVVRGMSWCSMCVFGSGRRWWRVDERIGFGIYQSVGTGGVLDVCLCCGGVCGECVGGLDQGLERWCYVCVSCDSGFYV